MNFPRTLLGAIAATALIGAATAASAAGTSLLDGIKKHSTVGSSVPDNGDQNPYALMVAPVSAGAIQKDDLLVDNFNDANNLQGLGTTIMDYRPSTKNWSTFAKLPRQLDGCPGGVGLTTAMTMLKSGWVIVGSTPSTDGTTATKGAGCLIVLDNTGKVAAVWNGPDINGPWGNMAVKDDGNAATLFISMAGFGLQAPTDDSPVLNNATILRLKLDIADGKAPVIASRQVVGSGFSNQADKNVFLIGPTGLALADDGTLYASDAIKNQIVAIKDALTRTDSAGTGTSVTQGGFMKRPLALCMMANGHLLSTNGLNGQVVEIDPASGQQLSARWIDADKAQTPPGSGDLFGIAVAPSGKGFYYVEDDNNTVVIAE